MKPTLVYYAKVPNMGDMLNKDIIEKCFDLRVVRKTYITGTISGIGSGLGNYTYEENIFKNIIKFISAPFFPTVYIWGTGFIKYKNFDLKFYKKNTNICALRGELSKERVEKILGHKINVPLGDAGILASNLLNEIPEKKYDMGIIAHYKEQNETKFQELLNNIPNSIFIDIKNKPYDVISKIAECKTIISSSLHGLIVADSLRIPNHHIVVTNKLLGDKFKFDDYYSAYGLKHEFTEMTDVDYVPVDFIIKNYKITDSMVKKKKKELLKCFPLKYINK